MRDLADTGPCLGGANRRGDAVGRLDVSDAEQVFRIGHRLVEEEIGAAVGKDRQEVQLFGDRT